MRQTWHQVPGRQNMNWQPRYLCRLVRCFADISNNFVVISVTLADKNNYERLIFSQINNWHFTIIVTCKSTKKSDKTTKQFDKLALSSDKRLQYATIMARYVFIISILLPILSYSPTIHAESTTWEL